MLEGQAPPTCSAVVIVPARNEEAVLCDTLDALAAQTDVEGRPLPRNSFEILLLLNNCSDASAAVARRWRERHSNISLHLFERTLPAEHAHVGTARRLLMDTAWSRLRGHAGPCGILSTDSDTEVASDWIAQNLRALGRGADAVGGVIELKRGELEQLPEGARCAFGNDQEFQRLQAELEDLLDPQAGDPWPRHLEHFGASLACTPAIYARAGGLPPVKPLEDMAFVDALYRMDARLRHEPAVRVFTSSRLEGRADVGLSWQLRTWQRGCEAGEPHKVPSCAWLEHRFRSLRFLRRLHRDCSEADLRRFSPRWRKRVREALARDLTTGEFLARLDCDAWIADTYTGGVREAEVLRVHRDLRAAIAAEREHLNCRAGDATRPGEGSYTPEDLSAIRAAAGPAGSGHIDARG